MVNEVIQDSTSLSEQISFINRDSMREFIIDYYKISHVQFAEHPFIDYDPNLNRIGVRQFNWKICIEMFQSDIFLRTHSIEQNKLMIEYFYSRHSKINPADDRDINTEEIPFLMDQHNCLQLTKDIYFPAETIGDSGTIDSNDLFVNKILFNWLNEYKQREIKQWLEKLGVTERTDLTYLNKTIIPNAATYITTENAIKTIKMLFILFQKHHIEKTELNQLKKLKLLTTRGTLIPAEQCFFSGKYKPRLSIEEYLSDTEDKFLSADYMTTCSFRCESIDILKWYQFFTAMGVHDDIHLLSYTEKINIRDAIQYGFNQGYLNRPSPNGRRPADAYSGLITITFLKNTKDNFEFAQLFWSFVIENMNPYDFKQHSTRIYWGSTYGSPISDIYYIEWFIKNIPCIPTTLNNCQLSINTFINTDEIKQLCGIYMPVIYISSKQNLSNWISFFNLKRKFFLNDYFHLFDKIRNDEKNLENNQDRIQNIYSHLLNESISWSIDEQNFIKTRSETLYLLTENNKWKFAQDLYFYVEENETNRHLNDVIPCLKLDFKNKNHGNLLKFLELFNIKQIKMNDLILNDQNSSPAEEFREKLIEISPFLKKWLKSLSISSEIISSIDRILQQDTIFIESDCLELFYNEKFIQETNVYFNTTHQQFYITRPWDSETTFMDLPNKLCQLLNIQRFEDKLRFLLKAQREEIVQKFQKESIEIPTDNDRIVLEIIPRSDIVTHCKRLPTFMELLNEPISDQDEQMSDEESSDDSKDFNIYARKTQELEQTNNANDKEIYTEHGHTDPSIHYDNIQLPNSKKLRTKSNKRKRKHITTTNDSLDKTFTHFDLIDLSSISNSSFVRTKTSFNRNGNEGNGETDMRTGLIGEQFVYKYLLNKYHHQLDSVSIHWLNESEETNLPYDILLIENGIKHYIEVKATRQINQHAFFVSLNQIKAILQYEDKYHIYRVYLKQKKLAILDNIESCLRDKNQLALLLTMNPKSLAQAMFTDE